jgi:polyribonucleotide nucleotidyltransferase
MDIKIDGIDEDLLKKALEQAKNGRLHILGKMSEIIEGPNQELSKYAPVITSVKVKADKIKIVIGPGGKNIKNIIAETGCKVDVDESGKVNVASSDPEASAKALAMIKELVAEPEVGVTYEGTVKKIMPFGAFVEIMPRCEGLLHISEIDHKRIDKVEDVLKEGDAVQVVLLAIDRDGKFKLSRKALIPRK